jgi:hypothetical protein
MTPGSAQRRVRSAVAPGARRHGAGRRQPAAAANETMSVPSVH